MKKNSPRQFAVALYEITKGVKIAELDNILRNFVLMLAKHRQLKSSGKIIDEFISYSKEKIGIMDISITSATKLDGETIEEVKKAFGRKVESTETVDKSLIGGIVVRTSERILDASIKTQILKLKQQLI